MSLARVLSVALVGIEGRLVELEADITKLERKQADLHEQLANAATYEDKAKTLQLVEEQRLLEKTLGAKLTRWEELCHLLG